MYNLYHCCKCGENFWLARTFRIKCPSCGNVKIERREIDLDLNNKSMTINNVTHGLKETGVIRINLRGERRKGLFSCNKCPAVFEADCTDGLHTVSCPNCHQKDFEAKSPIVSVLAGVAGLPEIKNSWTKQEKKLMKFAQNCYKSRCQLENQQNAVLNLMQSLEFDEEKIKEIEKKFKDNIIWLEEYHEKKISEYEERLGG